MFCKTLNPNLNAIHVAPHLKLWCFAPSAAPGLGLAAGPRQAHRMPRTKSSTELKQELSFYKKLNPYYYLEI